jgi:hypothetical protein
MNVQQYHAGEKAVATFDFVQGERVRIVTATFAHVDNPTTKFYLSGTPMEETASEGAGYTYWRVVLTRDVTAENEPGTYRCETVEAEYAGGRKVPFGGMPDVGIEIVKEEIPPPEITGGWEWGS